MCSILLLGGLREPHIKKDTQKLILGAFQEKIKFNLNSAGKSSTAIAVLAVPVAPAIYVGNI